MKLEGLSVIAEVTDSIEYSEEDEIKYKQYLLDTIEKSREAKAIAQQATQKSSSQNEAYMDRILRNLQVYISSITFDISDSKLGKYKALLYTFEYYVLPRNTFWISLVVIGPTIMRSKLDYSRRRNATSRHFEASIQDGNDERFWYIHYSERFNSNGSHSRTSNRWILTTYSVILSVF